MADLTTLPAITLHDPWARLCAGGVKTLETRKGPILSRFTGPLIIHRGKAASIVDYLESRGWAPAPRPPWADADWCEEQVEASCRGCALGVVYVVHTRRLTDWTRLPRAERRALQERARYHDLRDRYVLPGLIDCHVHTEFDPRYGLHGKRRQLRVPRPNPVPVRDPDPTESSVAVC